MSTRNVINNVAPSLAGVYLSGVKFVNGFANSNASGDFDMYTVPAGKTAFAYGMIYCNQAVTNTTVYPSIKVSGVYYQLLAGSTSTAGSAQTFQNSLGITLLAGETLAFNATQASMNAWARIIEFDDDNGPTIAKSLGMSNGDNTLYTCPSGKIAIMLDHNMSACAGTFHWNYFNLSGGTRTYVAYVVPNGDSPASGNQAFTTTLNNNLNASAGRGGQVLNAGDYIVFNTNSGAGTQSAWINMLEIDA